MKITKRPIIAVCTSMNDTHSQIRLNRSYFHAIYASGGLPVGLPFSGEASEAEEFFGSGAFDGVLFAGGCDIDPAEYGESITGEGVEIAPARDSFELRFARLLKATDVPVLGICRGIQTLNVAYGGTLFQDIPGHRQEEPGSSMPFSVRLEGDTVLKRLLGGAASTSVNSFHHQAVKDVAPGFVASAFSPDGFVEAIEPEESNGRFLIGVQWHPELFYDVSETSRVIFDAFVREAAKK